MLNITPKLVLFTMCGALLAAGSSASHASNVYSAAPRQADEAATTKPQLRYGACPAQYWWVCPSEVPAITAKADQGSRTDATVLDMPGDPTRSPEDESRYYDYSRMILGD